MANSAYDVGAKVAIQTENERVAPSMYGSAGSENVWNVDPHDLLFTVAGVQGSMGDSRLQVLPCLNGLGVNASVLYPDNPEMVRQSVKNAIQYIGVAYQYLSAARGDVERGVAVQLGGLHTVRIGNGQYGDDKVADTSIRPGDILVAEVPTPGQLGLQPGPGGRIREGVPANKYTLQVRRADHRSSGQALLTHVLALTSDPAKWRKAMGEHLLGTNAWHAAVQNIVQSYRVACLIGVGEFIAAGVLLPTEEFSGAYGFAGAANSRDNADNTVLKLAELLTVLPRTPNTQTQLDAVGAFTRGDIATLGLNLARRIFHQASDVAYEFGFRARDGGAPASSDARYVNPSAGNHYRIKQETPAGRMLLEQINHFPRAVAGFHYAVQRDLSNVIGKATTGGSAEGSGKVHAFLGLNAS